MAEIKLIFKPDFSEVSKGIKTLQEEISKSLGTIHIKVDSGSAQETQSLAANLQKASGAASSAEAGVAKLIKTYKGLNETEADLQKTVTVTNDELGRRVKVIEENAKKGKKITKEVTEDYEKNEKERREIAADTAKYEEQIRQKQQKTWQQFVKEQGDYEAEQHRKNAEAIRFEAEEQAKARKEQEQAAAEAEKHRQDQIKRDQQAAEAAEKAAQAQVNLEKQYSNLLRQIQELKSQYPEGTFDAIEQQAREAMGQLRSLDRTTETYAEDVKRLGRQFREYQRDVANARQETQKLETVSESFVLTFQRIFRWYLGGRLISELTSALRDALQTIKEVDSALVTVQKTTGYSREQIDELTDSAYALASAYGRTATEILNSASVFARAGFKDNLEDMTELSALLQNVGDLAETSASKFLIATNAAWKLNGSYTDLLRVIDGLNAQTNQAAVDMEALTSGITVAGSVFSNAGESVQTFAGLLGAGVAATQRSGSEIARGLRTIAMNIRQIKGELEDGEIIDAESISDAAAALSSVGISVADTNGELRLTSEVLGELAGKWNSLTTAEQSYLAQSLAGKRQANVLTALMQNWKEAERQMALYANGAGSAMKENEIYLDSWEAKTKQLSAEWTKFVAQIVDTDTVKRALDGLITLVDALNSGFGKTTITVAAIPALIMAVVSAVKLLGTTILTNPFLFMLGAVAAAFLAAETAAIKATRAVEELQDAAKEAKSAYDEIRSKISDLESRTENLTELEKKRLEILRLEAVEAEKEAKQKALSAYYASYSGELNRTGQFTAEWKSYNSQDKARELLKNYYDLQSKLKNAGSTAEMDKLESQIRKTISAITDMADDLLSLEEILGDDMPQAGKNALEMLSTFISGLNNADEAEEVVIEETEAVTEEIDKLRDSLQNLSDSADVMDTAIGGVTDAMSKFGAQSVQVYDAMRALEAAIPGSTDQLYDFRTGALLVDEALFEDKESVLDLIDAMRQVDFTDAINEAERAASAAWDMAEAWTAVLPMMGGVFANAAMASNAYAGSLQSQRSAWNARVSTLRQRSDYRPKEDTTKGTGGSTKSVADTELERLKDIVSLRKSELDFLEASGKSEEEINAKRKEIQAALHDQAEYMRSIGADQKDILSLSTEWWKIQKEINDEAEKTKELQRDMFDTLKGIVDDYYSDLLSDKEKELSLEEKILAVQKAEADLANAQKERTVRYFNAATGQWEWAANAKNVKSAEDALKKAQDDLNKYQKDQAWKEFKDAWAYVANQIKSGAMTFKDAYDYMYKSMKEIQDKYGVDLSMTLEDSIGGFKNLNYGIDGLTQDVANSLGNSVGLLNDKLKGFKTAVDAMEYAFTEAGKKVKAGELTIEDAYLYLRTRAKDISNRFGVDMTGAIDKAIAGFDKTNGTIEELWRQVVITLMKANSVNWFTASDSEKEYLHAQNEYLGSIIGANYDSGGYWNMNGSRLYDPRDEAGIYDSGGILKGVGGIKATNRDEFVLSPELTAKMLDPRNNDLSRRAEASMSRYFDFMARPSPIVPEIGTQNNGDTYTMNGVTIGEEKAKTTTVYELARLARTLSIVGEGS